MNRKALRFLLSRWQSQMYRRRLTHWKMLKHQKAFDCWKQVFFRNAQMYSRAEKFILRRFVSKWRARFTSVPKVIHGIRPYLRAWRRGNQTIEKQINQCDYQRKTPIKRLIQLKTKYLLKYHSYQKRIAQHLVKNWRNWMTDSVVLPPVKPSIGFWQKRFDYVRENARIDCAHDKCWNVLGLICTKVKLNNGTKVSQHSLS